MAREGGVQSRPALPSGWEVLAFAAAAGFALGAGLAAVFKLLHSNWSQIPGVTQEATATAPFWTVQFLGPVLVSVFWTGLILRSRAWPRWGSATAATLAVQLLVLAVALVPIAVAGNGGLWIAGFAQLLVVLLALASPLLALLWPGPRAGRAVGWHVAAAVAFAAALWLGQALLAPEALLI